MASGTWPAGPRYVVRELTGFAITSSASKPSGHALPGLTVWVADEARCGEVVQSWRSEDDRDFTRISRFTAIKNAAGMLAQSLNDAERYEARKAGDVAAVGNSVGSVESA